MKITRRQALAIVPAVAVGTTVAGKADATTTDTRYENLQDLLVSVIRHTQKTGDKILEANEPLERLFGWIAVPQDGGWPADDCPVTRVWKIMQGHIIVTGNRMDPRFNAAIVQVTGDQGWLMTGEKRRAFNAKAHLVDIPPNLAPCTPAPWSIYADDGVKA